MLSAQKMHRIANILCQVQCYRGRGYGHDTWKQKDFPEIGRCIRICWETPSNRCRRKGLQTQRLRLYLLFVQVVLVQRDYGDRLNRKHARLKYTIEDRGIVRRGVACECACGVGVGWCGVWWIVDGGCGWALWFTQILGMVQKRSRNQAWLQIATSTTIPFYG